MADDAIKKRLEALGGYSADAPQPPASHGPPGPSRSAAPAASPAAAAARPSRPVPVPPAAPAPAPAPDAALAQAEQAFRSGDLTRSLLLAEGVMSANPSNPDAHFLAGKVHAARNALDRAIASFDRAHRLAPGRFDLVLEYAISLFNANRRDEALTYFQTAAGLQPENQTVRNYLALLARTAGGARPHRPMPSAGPSVPPPAAPGSSAYVAPRPASGPGGTPYVAARPASGPGGTPYVTTRPASGAGGTPYGYRPPSGPAPSQPSWIPRPASGGGTSHVPPPPPAHVSTAPQPQQKELAIAEAFTPHTESRDEQVRRLRALDQAAMEDSELDLQDPEFWEKYHHYSTTRAVQLSEAEKAGDIHLISQDFTKIHQESFERELDEKAHAPILRPATGWLLSHLCWPLGLLYLGNSGGAASRFMLQLVLLALIAAAGWLAWTPVYTEANFSAQWGPKVVADMLKEDPRIFIDRQNLITTMATGMAVFLGLVYVFIQRRFAASISAEARRRNMSLGLITDISQNLEFEINLGSLHGVTPDSHLIVEKRSFRAGYDNATEASGMHEAFARIGRCEILEVFETSTHCAFKPDKGRIVIPKVGDRVSPVDLSA